MHILVFIILEVQQVKKKEKKRNTPIYFNTNYRAEMKLIPIHHGL